MVRPKSPVRLDWVNPAVCSLDYRLKIIGRLPFFKHLPVETISKINALFHDRDARADESINYISRRVRTNSFKKGVMQISLLFHS
jgi:hypothetical protein